MDETTKGFVSNFNKNLKKDGLSSAVKEDFIATLKRHPAIGTYLMGVVMLGSSNLGSLKTKEKDSESEGNTVPTDDDHVRNISQETRGGQTYTPDAQVAQQYGQANIQIAKEYSLPNGKLIIKSTPEGKTLFEWYNENFVDNGFLVQFPRQRLSGIEHMTMFYEKKFSGLPRERLILMREDDLAIGAEGRNPVFDGAIFNYDPDRQARLAAVNNLLGLSEPVKDSDVKSKHRDNIIY